MSSIPRTRVLLPLALALAAGSIGVAQAADARLSLLSFTQPASSGLSVKAPLDEFVAVSRARVAVPSAWRRLSSKPGQLRMEDPHSTSCHYRVTFTVSTRLAAAADVERYVAAALPAPSEAYLLDSGVHGSRAFRVVR